MLVSLGAMRRAVTPASLGRPLRRGFEGNVLRQFVKVDAHPAGLATKKLFHGARELRVREPVAGVGCHRQEAARELVLALCATLEHADCAGDAELDRLIVAGLE